MAAPPTPAAQALLGALADRPGATATELAAAAGIGRSTASKLLATLAVNGEVLRQPGGHQGGRRTPDRWTLPTPLRRRPRSRKHHRPPRHRQQLANSLRGRGGCGRARYATWYWPVWPSGPGRRYPLPRSPRP
jgi:hypothetical protein